MGLLGTRTYVDTGADCEEQASIEQDLDDAQYGIAANVVLLLELLHRRQRAVLPLALGDPGSETGG